MKLFLICIFAACVAAQATQACSGLTEKPKDCGKWALGGFCDKAANKEWMQQNCAVSCCETSQGEFGEDDENCKDWAEEWCGKNDFVDKNCKRSCKQLAKQRTAAQSTITLDSLLAELEESSESDEMVKNNATDMHTCYNKTDVSTLGEDACRNWAWTGSCLDAKYKDYMDSNCAYTCCERTSAGVRDENQGCRGWARSGWCGKSLFMDKNCKKSCTHGDRDASCQTWAGEGKCEADEFVQKNCKKACGNWKKKVQEARRKAKNVIKNANKDAFLTKKLALKEKRDAGRKARKDQNKLVKEISKDKQAEIKNLRKVAKDATKAADKTARDAGKTTGSRKEKKEAKSKAKKVAREAKEVINKKLREDINKIVGLTKEAKQAANQVRQEVVSEAKEKQQGEKAKANAQEEQTVKTARDAVKEARDAAKAAKKAKTKK